MEKGILTGAVAIHLKHSLLQGISTISWISSFVSIEGEDIDKYDVSVTILKSTINVDLKNIPRLP